MDPDLHKTARLSFFRKPPPPPARRPLPFLFLPLPSLSSLAPGAAANRRPPSPSFPSHPSRARRSRRRRPPSPSPSRVCLVRRSWRHRPPLLLPRRLASPHAHGPSRISRSSLSPTAGRVHQAAAAASWPASGAPPGHPRFRWRRLFQEEVCLRDGHLGRKEEDYGVHAHCYPHVRRCQDFLIQKGGSPPGGIPHWRKKTGQSHGESKFGVCRMDSIFDVGAVVGREACHEASAICRCKTQLLARSLQGCPVWVAEKHLMLHLLLIVHSHIQCTLISSRYNFSRKQNTDPLQ